MTGTELAALLESFSRLPYDGEAIDQREHSLQCAGLALAAREDDAFVLACALHDVGRAPSVAARLPNLPHERAGERFLDEVLGARAAALVGAHVAAKRYLVAVDAEYRELLSETSIRSLERQGGPLSSAELAEFGALPYRDEALRLRRYDDRAKVPGAQTPSINEIVRIYERYSAAAARP
ncbi:MAG TPA: HD domain-containing protein [Candidatus Acidoferrales bacterium]|nr:HD domain-containing protein [Candidatus Acidoferrales bacterium]